MRIMYYVLWSIGDVEAQRSLQTSSKLNNIKIKAKFENFA
jgi:hypothetical protein